ncbi:UDP-GlcNAc:undecaprenyl-phosphate GlcNAc-1-phosphate transferase [Caldanaerobius fijiensis DSM 17918]|uniref:UDP-GlcNAc:undecaprenyl-phosphate GlcNAc-1-phosphate transferase n=1 Tax=Caldanaerobius fijiensis DSM 17918 TaxID=1121256 RepID=A0A1M4UPS4_9THEO|nr:MraY family glycosyltransferase [Caldanaerobius fijiensis]SHE58714.1 UDP-GlcNAc:undecaprenyl-phosphate GlcNAc-1-phosphate transferase [Caldanaerobius fijiensis DSM 17918]
MLKYILAFVIAFLLTCVFTPLAKKIAYAIGAIDVPKDERRVHKKPVPLLGGLSIYLSFLVGAIIFVPKNSHILGLLIGSTIIIIVGVLDDKYELSAIAKLFGQIMAAVVVMVYGMRINVISNPFGDSINLGLWAYPITLIWIVAITNTLNLIDGLDGLAAGVAGIASFFLFIVSLLNSRDIAAILTIITAGSALGFLPFNFNPAKIFMGDTGALLLGFILSVISVEGAIKGAAAIAIIVPVLVLGLPIFDMIVSIIRRSIKGMPIMQADKGHIHHRLLDMGMSQRRAVIYMYIICIVLGISAIVVSAGNTLTGILVISLVILLAMILTKRMNLIGLNDDRYRGITR